MSAVLGPGDTSWVGYGIGKRDLTPKGIPVTLGGAPRCYLLVAYILRLDDEGVYLTVAKSNYGLYLDEALDEMLLHYDYDRDPGNAYPIAHLQFSGVSPAIQQLCNRASVAKELKDLHFPVGGKRYRPTLEDLLEFLIVEDLAVARPDWRQHLEGHRGEWERRQLKAAVRRDPESAREVLATLPNQA